VTARTVYVTGMGVVSCLGPTVPRFWDALCAGESGIGPITRFGLEGSPYAFGGQVRDFDPLPFEECSLSVGAQYAAEAVAQALSDFPISLRQKMGLVMATNFGPAELIESYLQGEDAGGTGGYSAGVGFFAEDARRVAHRTGIGGPVVNISLSCASGNAAIALALDLIRAGRADAVLACGYDSVARISWAGLGCLRVMSLPRDGSRPRVRPFDVDRDGTLFSEGAGCLLLESERSAGERGADVLAEVAGAGSNNNAFHLTRADSEGEGTAVAMRMALTDAGMSPDDVDHFNAHGTGTKLNDVIESRALALVFGDRAGAIPVTSNKGGLGHGMGAASSFEAIASVMTLRDQRIPPTVNHNELAPDCPVDVVSAAPRDCELRVVLSNSAGIGGSNAAVVLRRTDSSGEGES